jgi:transcriptional regulator with XRE-family HTH domain
MTSPGLKLRQARERLDLRYRDVEEASIRIARSHESDEFLVSISRLSDIETKGTLPSIYRLYSLCVIYRLDFREVLEWYGIDLSKMPGDYLTVHAPRTHMIAFEEDEMATADVPVSIDPSLDPLKTQFLSRMIRGWGSLPLMLFRGLASQELRYAFIGEEDDSMGPIIPPGSFIAIDENRRKIQSSGWTSEYDRPIYFLETRDGYYCRWCSLQRSELTMIAHPSCAQPPLTMRMPAEVDVVGEVIGWAKSLHRAPQPHTHS